MSFPGWQNFVCHYISVCPEDNAALKMLEASHLGLSQTLPVVLLLSSGSAFYSFAKMKL